MAAIRNLNGGSDASMSGYIDKPKFEIDNSHNIMLLTGAATDTRTIVESFLQANFRMRSRYKCAMMHCCVRENKLTHDTYYIVKNIIQSIVRTVPAIKNLLLLQTHDYFTELLTSKAEMNQNQRLQMESPDIFIKFCKVIKQIKLDFNIAVFITGIENLWEQSNLQNLIYILRSASLVMPPFLRFVLTAEKRESKDENLQKVLKILQTSKIYDVLDVKFFENEAHSLLDFAFTYSEQQR